jgi:hypothetical protein
MVEIRMRRILATLSAGLILATALPAAAQELRRTDDRHVLRRFDPVGPQMLDLPRSPEPARPRPVLLRSPKSLADLGKYDAKASAACRARDFGQFEQHRATVILAGRTYGAALSPSDDLADWRGLAAPNTLYVFEQQSTTACRVWRMRPPR